MARIQRAYGYDVVEDGRTCFLHEPEDCTRDFFTGVDVPEPPPEFRTTEKARMLWAFFYLTDRAAKIKIRWENPPARDFIAIKDAPTGSFVYVRETATSWELVRIHP